MAEPPERDGPALTLHEAARRTGALAWAERRLYEILGGWVPSTGPARVKVFLAARSAEHEEHAQWLYRRLPQLAGVDPSVLAGPPSAEAEACLAQVAALSDPAERLAAVYRAVLPALLVAQRRLMRLAHPAADGPVVRAVRLVAGEETEEWLAAEEILAALLADQADHERVAAVAARLSWRWTRSGGVEGPDARNQGSSAQVGGVLGR